MKKLALFVLVALSYEINQGYDKICVYEFLGKTYTEVVPVYQSCPLYINVGY